MGVDDLSPIERVGLQFVDAVDAVAERLPSWRAYLALQMRRAALSGFLNLREGGGEFRPLEKARFYRLSLRSIRETVGCLLVVAKLHPASEELLEAALELARELAPSIGRMAVYHGRRGGRPRAAKLSGER